MDDCPRWLRIALATLTLAAVAAYGAHYARNPAPESRCYTPLQPHLDSGYDTC